MLAQLSQCHRGQGHSLSHVLKLAAELLYLKGVVADGDLEILVLLCLCASGALKLLPHVNQSLLGLQEHIEPLLGVSDILAGLVSVDDDVETKALLFDFCHKFEFMTQK